MRRAVISPSPLVCLCKSTQPAHVLCLFCLIDALRHPVRPQRHVPEDVPPRAGWFAPTVREGSPFLSDRFSIPSRLPRYRSAGQTGICQQ